MTIRISMVFIGVFLLLGMPGRGSAFFWDQPQELVTINGAAATVDDYRNWWGEWREKDQPVPETPDEFVDWMLLYHEAQAMQLDRNPEYQKKLAIFLKVRSLMQLKQDEVSSRARMPDQETLWGDYLKEYTPLFNLRLVAVNSEEQAGVLQRLLAEGVPLAEAARKTGLDKVAEQLAATGLMRAKKIPDPIREAVSKVAVGKSGGPVAYGHAWYFFEVLERSDGSEDDFNKLKDQLVRQSLKNQENELTRELTDTLTRKYQVVVDESLIAKVTPQGFPAEEGEKIVIKVGNAVVSLSTLHQAVVKEQQTRGGAHRNAESFEATRQRIVADAIAQTVTGLEALDRHYETQPPLKSIYEFYRQHRMIKELEKTAILPRVKVSAADAETYYREHPELFSRGGIVEVAVVQTNETALAEKLAKRLKNGEDFFTVMRPLAPSGIETRRTPADHLQPVIQKALAEMSPGQVSGALPDGENIYFVKLIKTGEEESIPLAKVAEQILTELRTERFTEVRKQMVEQLRKRSTIKVNDEAWNDLKKTLTEEGASDHGA